MSRTDGCGTILNRSTGRQTAPSNLTGANGFAGQGHCSRVCGAEHRRAAGAPLTVALDGKRIFGTVGRVPALIGLARCRRPRNGEQPHTQGSGTGRPASARRARQRSARGRCSADATGANRPPPFPTEDLVVTLALLSGTPRLQLSIPLRGLGPRTACQRRALEPVEEVATTSAALTITGDGSTDRSLRRGASAVSVPRRRRAVRR